MLSELTQYCGGYTCSSLDYSLAELVGTVWCWDWEDGNYHIVNSIRRKIQIGHTVMNAQVIMIMLLRAGLHQLELLKNTDLPIKILYQFNLFHRF